MVFEGKRNGNFEKHRESNGAMVRAMCGAKLIKKTRTEDLMEMFGLKETVVQVAKANGLRWFEHVLRRGDGHVFEKSIGV